MNFSSRDISQTSERTSKPKQPRQEVQFIPEAPIWVACGSRGGSSHMGGEGEGPAHGKIEKISSKLLGEGFGGGGKNVVFFGQRMKAGA